MPALRAEDGGVIVKPEPMCDDITDYERGWNEACEEWERWEKERPARWIYESGVAICSACVGKWDYADLVGLLGDECPLIAKAKSPDTCPDCGRKMEV